MRRQIGDLAFEAVRRHVVDCPRRGRHRDDSRDPEIMRAALELLAELGYDRLTMEAVAGRVHAGKATLYRRWQGKAELVVDAITCFRGPAVKAAVDSGSLRGDLRAVFLAAFGDLDDFTVGLMTGLVSVLKRNPEFAAVFEERFIAQVTSSLREIFIRARERGEVADGHDLDLLATVGPALFFHRLLLSGKPLTRHYIGRVIDEVILPLAGAESPRKVKS
jgi:AcrR family transcriptional regulator